MGTVDVESVKAFIQGRMDAAQRDKLLYDRDGARLNGQLLQGEINMGAAVIAWLDKQAADAAESGEDEDEAAEHE